MKPWKETGVTLRYLHKFDDALEARVVARRALGRERRREGVGGDPPPAPAVGPEVVARPAEALAFDL